MSDAADVSTRRSRRERKKPTQIYTVLDLRPSTSRRDGGDDGSNDDDDDDGLDESESTDNDDEEEEEADARQFVSPKPKPRAHGTRPGPAKRKPATLVRPRKLKPVQEEGESTRKGSDASSDDSDTTMFFEAIKRGTGSLRTLMIEWRDRFEANAEDATREVLNFLLQACGGEGQCVPTTEALEKLDMSDLVDYVVDDLTRAHDGYPIASRAKAFRRFERNFVAFWDAFVTECFESELLFTATVVHQFVDWCSTLSSAEVRAIRHTATVAAYAIGHALVVCAESVSQQLAVVTRQLHAADANAKKTPPGKVSKKQQLLLENKALYSERLQQLVKVVSILFSGVVVHRYRDVMPEVRAASASAIGRWIAALPTHFLKDNYLKYLGWMLNDKDASVRLRVVHVLQRLYEHEAFTDKLELFTSRFLPRFLELCDDVDDAVVRACVRLLIAVDKRSLISSDVDLQAVERLVFEPANAEIRRAAAEFVCLQYDAFGVAESTDNATLKREQLNTQAIALVEFAEEYIYNHNAPPECVETLVEAFWRLADCQVLLDWRLLTDLLLADKSAPDLTSNQQSILIRLLVAAVRKLAADDAKKKSTWETGEMTVAFCKEIPSLLVRYQSDAEKLSLVVELIPTLALTADVIGPHLGHVTELLEKLKSAYIASADETLLVALSHALDHLLQAEHEVVKRETEVTIREIVQDVMDHVQRALEDDATMFEHDQDDSALSRKRAKTPAKDVSDMEFALRISLSRLTCLIRFVNVREYLPSSSGATFGSRSADARPVERMERVASALVALIHRRTRNVVQLREELWQAEAIKHTLLVLYLDLLWLTRAVFNDALAQTTLTLGADAAHDECTSVRVTRAGIERVLERRAALEDCFVSVLEMHLEKTTQRSSGDDNDADSSAYPTEMEEIVFDNDDLTQYVKAAQRMAFVTFCDTRCLFVEKFEDATAPFDALQWPLPRILVLLTQMYFENEMEAPDVDASDAQQAHKAELLLALGRVSASNPSNRRQSAAVLRYVTETAKPSVEIVKAYGRHVKHEMPVRYLEVQMTALRQQYNSILALKEELDVVTSTRSNGETVDSDDDMRCELEESIESSEVQLKDLAKKLSQSLGVGKIAPALRAPFFRFVCEGVRYALERREHFSFLDSLRPYLGHLDPSSMKQLRTYFVQLLGELNDAPEREEQLSQEWRIVFDFQSAIAGAAKRKEPPVATPTTPKRTADELVAAPSPTTPSAIAAPTSSSVDARASSLVSNKRKRSLELEDVADTSESPRGDRDGGAASAALSDRPGSVARSPVVEQPAHMTPAVQRHLQTPGSEHKSNEEAEGATGEETEVDNDSQPTATATPSPHAVATSSRKRVIASVEASESRRTRASYRKQKQARRSSSDANSSSAVTNAPTGGASDDQAQRSTHSNDSNSHADDDEIDSRRSRRRRRSLLADQRSSTNRP